MNSSEWRYAAINHIRPERFLFVALTASCLYGCIPAYVQPATTSNTATLTITRNNAYFNYYHVVDNSECANSMRLPNVSNKSYEVAVTIPANGEKLFLWQASMTENPPYFNYCDNLVSFIPQKDHHYITLSEVQKAGLRCSLVILDKDTNGIATAFQPVKFNPRPCNWHN